MKNDDGNWKQVEDASCCTSVPYNMPEKELRAKLESLFKEYRELLTEYPPERSVKKLGETLSWI